MSRVKDQTKVISAQISKVNKKTPMVFYLTMFIFIVCCITAAVLFGIYILMVELGWVFEINLVWTIVILLFSSIVISTSLVRGFGNRIIFRNLRPIINAFKAVANGDFTQRLEPPKERETAEICEGFNEMVNKLGKNELLASDFVSNVSHQFRTPLASIRGYAQLLESNDLTEKERLEYVAIIEEKALSLSDLVNDILELSRLENQSAALSKEVFKLDEQLRKCLLSMEKQMTEKNIEVDISLETVDICANKELLAEVWNNLLENAIKFSHENQTIKIILVSNGKNATVTVKDEGIGMAEETKERLFDRFYRSNDVQGFSGCGLGMSIVRNIVEKHNGTITVETSLGKGSTFKVNIPLNSR